MKLEVDYMQIPHGSTLCIGFFLLEGQTPNSIIAAKRLSLSKFWNRFTNHLPILLLACRTHMSAMIGDADLARRRYHADRPEQDILVLWLVTVKTKRPLRASLSGFSQDGIHFREVSGLKVRNFHDAQKVEEFLCGPLDYLNLSAGTLKLLTGNGGNENILVGVNILKE